MALHTALPDDFLATVYCTDEHIAIRAPTDYTVLCPASNVLAANVDGFIAQGTTWRLSAKSTDFEAAGVAHGNVVLLTAPATRFPGAGEQFAVESVDDHSLILRRIGQQAGIGQAPGIGANMTGVAFTIQTYSPQIEEVSYYLNRKYQIDPAIPARAPAKLYELRDLRDACVLEVLCRRLMTEVNPSAGPASLQKYNAYCLERDEIYARLHLRWMPSVYGDAPTSNPFSTRLVR